MASAVFLFIMGATTLVGAFVQGITSFGYAVVSWSIYSILIQLHIELDYHTFLVCLTCFACSTISLYNLVQVRGHLVRNLPAIFVALTPELPGNLAGVWLSRVVPVPTLRLIIGGIFVAMSLPRISQTLLAMARGDAAVPQAGASCVAELASGDLPKGRCRMPESTCSSPWAFALGLALTGVASGLCHGLVGIPGPPWMLYFAFVALSKSDARVIFSTFELVGSFNFLVTYGTTGQLKGEEAPLYLTVATSCLVGVALGNLVHPHVSADGVGLSLLGLTSLSGVQALGAFDLSNRVGGGVRLLLLVWLVALLIGAAWRRGLGKRIVGERCVGSDSPNGRDAGESGALAPSTGVVGDDLTPSTLADEEAMCEAPSPAA